MKRPSFQFYPGDWSGNSNLRRCTHAEKGAWVDVLCLMHDQEEYGVLRWPLKEIARAAGCPVSLLKGLAAKGVLKGDDKELIEPFIYTPRSGRKDGEPVELVAAQPGPIWYSSRMVKDEHVRTIRGEGSRFGDGQGDAPKPTPKRHTKASPKPPFGDGSSSSSSSSSSDSVEPSGSTGAGAPPGPPGPPVDPDPPVMPADPPPPPRKPPGPLGQDAGLTPQESLFQVAVPWLVARGMRDAAARSLLGGAVKQLGPEAAWELASECIRLEILEPAAWLSRSLNERIAAGSQRPRRPGQGGPPMNRQEALEARNREIARQMAHRRPAS